MLSSNQARAQIAHRSKAHHVNQVSTALAGAVVLSAFHQRANFYSAMVYLAQSNFCLLVRVAPQVFLVAGGTVMVDSIDG